MEKKLNIGTFEVLPRDKFYPNLLHFLNDYERDRLNSDGLRIASYKESNFLIKEFKELGISENLKKYYYTFISEIVISYDPYGTGRHKEAIIDDPEEVIKFQYGEEAYGYDSDGSQIEFHKGDSNIEDWTEENSIYFVVRPL
jgi:hypothetical protein